MLLVVDTETSGLSPAEGHTVVELAAVALRVKPGVMQGRASAWDLAPHPFTTLVAPGRRLSPEAQAVHHLRDVDLRAAPHLPQAIEALKKHYYPPITPTFAAHNVQFDRAFIGVYFPWPGTKWLCTYRLACHLYPHAPGHSNQVLRYYIGLDAEVRAALPNPAPPPHRALTDAITTAVLLKYMLTTHTLEDLLILQDQPVLQKTVKFGKYRGKPWAEIPKDYLSYVLRQNGPGGFDADVMHTANFYLKP